MEPTEKFIQLVRRLSDKHKQLRPVRPEQLKERKNEIITTKRIENKEKP
jgi:hypothetical protein